MSMSEISSFIRLCKSSEFEDKIAGLLLISKFSRSEKFEFESDGARVDLVCKIDSIVESLGIDFFDKILQQISSGHEGSVNSKLLKNIISVMTVSQKASRELSELSSDLANLILKSMESPEILSDLIDVLLQLIEYSPKAPLVEVFSNEKNIAKMGDFFERDSDLKESKKRLTQILSYILLQEEETSLSLLLTISNYLTKGYSKKMLDLSLLALHKHLEKRPKKDKEDPIFVEILELLRHAAAMLILSNNTGVVSDCFELIRTLVQVYDGAWLFGTHLRSQNNSIGKITEEKFPTIILSVMTVEIKMILEEASKKKTPQEIQKITDEMRNLVYMGKKFIDLRFSRAAKEYFDIDENSKAFKRLITTIFRTSFDILKRFDFEDKTSAPLLKAAASMALKWRLENTHQLKDLFSQNFPKIISCFNDEEFMMVELDGIATFLSYCKQNEIVSIIASGFPSKCAISSQRLLKHFLNTEKALGQREMNRISKQCDIVTLLLRSEENELLEINTCEHFLELYATLEEIFAGRKKHNNKSRAHYRCNTSLSNDPEARIPRRAVFSDVAALYFALLSRISQRVNGRAVENAIGFLFNEGVLVGDSELWYVVLEELARCAEKKTKFVQYFIQSGWLNSYTENAFENTPFVKNEALNEIFQDLLLNLSFSGDEGIDFLNTVFETLGAYRVKRLFPYFYKTIPNEFVENLF